MLPIAVLARELPERRVRHAADRYDEDPHHAFHESRRFRGCPRGTMRRRSGKVGSQSSASHDATHCFYILFDDPNFETDTTPTVKI